MEDFSSNYEFLFPVLNVFTVDIEEYFVGISDKVNDGKSLTVKTSSLQFYLTLSNCQSCMLSHLTDANKNKVNSLVLCIFGSDLKDMKLYIRVR